jgi:2,4-dienoyl-CoA reductase-like NADH-dependent reductase (Old Yellow Enzyme family)
MVMPDIHFLFEPTIWRGKTIPSRILLAPINTGFAQNNRPSIKLLNFHRRRSGPTVGVSIVGNVVVSCDATLSPGTAVLSQRTELRRFCLIARAIRLRGSLAGIQIASSPIGLSPSRPWRTPNLATEVNRLQQLTAGLTQSDLRGSISQFINTALLSVEAGFDFIQIHAAHGYLLSLLLNPEINRRADHYACDGPWLGEFVDALRASLASTLLSFRISIASGFADQKREREYDSDLVVRLAGYGVDLIDLSAGLYTVDRHLIYPSLRAGPAPLFSIARDLALKVPCLVAFAGNVLDLRDLPTDMPRNLFCAAGRAFIADPDFADKSARELFDEIHWCQRTGHCHYFTRGHPNIECGVNLLLGRTSKE